VLIFSAENSLPVENYLSLQIGIILLHKQLFRD